MAFALETTTENILSLQNGSLTKSQIKDELKKSKHLH